MALVLRDLYSLDDFKRVVALETLIWGLRDEVVPSTVLAAGVSRGAVLVGAFDADELVGFTYAFPAISHGKLIQWSHMTGVADGYRDKGLGLRLKLAQRERALAMGIERVDWTFDPLQATNAHFNLRRLGAIVEHYEVNVYGELASPLHGSMPTDRFIAQWWLASEHVAARLDERDEVARGRPVETTLVNPIARDGDWTVCDWDALVVDAPRVQVAIPPDYTRMLALAPDVALRWRLTTRRIFQSLLGQGRRISDFVRDADGGGRYLVVQDVA